MTDQNSTQHRSILKALFFFGSLQVIQTIISLLKVKYVSVIIGPSGLGELTLYTTFSNTVVYIAGFGLFNSAVRNISIANGLNDLSEIRRIFNLVTKILVITSIFSCVIILVFNKQIDKLFFDKPHDANNNFALLSIVIFFSVFSNRNNMLIQGMGKYKDFGKAALISSIISLLVIIPLFYFYKNEAIVPSLIFSALIVYIVSEFYKRSLSLSTSFDFNFKNLYSNSNQLIKLGIVMMFSSLFGNIITNLINIFITRQGSSYDLGLYNAAITISLQYVSLVFVSLSSEFYPRLSSISHDYEEVRNMVNKQIEVVLVVLFPLLFLMQVFASTLVKTLFSTQFLTIIPFVQFSTVAIIFQALAYVISNIPMAMGQKKFLFLYNSLFPGIISLTFSLLGYKYFGLMGLVYALYIVNIFHFLSMYLIVKNNYSFSINRSILNLIYFILALLTFSLIVVNFINGFFYYFFIGFAFLGVTYFTFKKSSQIFGFNYLLILNRFKK